MVQNSTKPFSGKTINKTSSSEAFKRLDFTPHHNILDNIDQSSYHIKFSVLSDIPGVDSEVVIAETGKTELNIVSMTMNSFVGPELVTKNTTDTKISMTILEVGNRSLIDRILQASLDLHVRNYTKTPFIITLSFLGRNSENGKATSMSKKWSWKVIIGRINSRITSSGCEHNLDLYPISDVASTDDYMRIPQSYTVSGKTCGQIINELFGMMNADINAKYGDVQMVKYQIDATPYPSSAQSPVKTPLDHIVTNSSAFDTARSKNIASMNTGMGIHELVDVLLSNSETAVKVANGIGSSAPASTTTSTKKHVTLCRVEKVVTYGNYIDLFADYEKTITYVLVPYDTIRVVGNMDQYMNIHDKDETRTKVDHLITSGLMQKEYDYYYTGKNTDIVNLDISLSFDYYVAVNIMLGAMTYSTKTIGQAYNKTAQDRASAYNYQGYVDKLNSLIREQQSLQGDTSSEQYKSSFAALQDQINAQQKIISQSKGAVAQSLRDAENRDNSRISSAKKDLSKRSKTLYSDDEDYSNVTDNIQRLPVTLRQVPRLEHLVDGVVESNHDTRRSIYAAMLDQFYGNIDANLTSIKMEIKGDPFWLGAPGKRELFSNSFTVAGPDITLTSGIKISGETSESKKWANYPIGENVFVLRYKNPSGLNEKTGQMSFYENNSYTGFYTVTQVTHSFNRGVFTQTLQGFRVVGADVSKVIRSK